MSDSEKKRPYNSRLRQQQAEATRKKIIEAARRLFVAQGYTITTLPEIAREAGVSMASVTSIFGTKLALLDALIKLNVRGDETPTPLAARSAWQAMLQEPDPIQQLMQYAANLQRIHHNSTDLFEIVRGAATADLEIARLRRELNETRLGDVHLVAQSLAQHDALRPGIKVEQATDLLWALGSAEMYRMLVVDRGWSPSAYAEWLTQTLINSLLESGGFST